jgi:PPK2 family polyphosphate:nucleotide phosphotransferase
MAREFETSNLTSLRDTLRVADGDVNLLGYDTTAKPLAPGGKSKTVKKLTEVGPSLANLQEMLYANGVHGDPRRLLLVLQGMDTSGKDSVIRHAVGLVGPLGTKVTAFRQPTPEEAAHHFLWRIRKALPAPGIVGVFNRSYYEDVLVPKVQNNIDHRTFAERIDDINHFESQLVDSGTVIVKCFLHISYTEQRERLLARLDDPTKIWKFSPSDIDARAYWSDYQRAYSSVIAKTSTDAAPWYVVPSDTKWYRNWAVAELLTEALLEMKLDYPRPEFDVGACRARLQPPY